MKKRILATVIILVCAIAVVSSIYVCLNGSLWSKISNLSAYKEYLKNKFNDTVEIKKLYFSFDPAWADSSSYIAECFSKTDSTEFSVFRYAGEIVDDYYAIIWQKEIDEHIGYVSNGIIGCKSEIYWNPNTFNNIAKNAGVKVPSYFSGIEKSQLKESGHLSLFLFLNDSQTSRDTAFLALLDVLNFSTGNVEFDFVNVNFVYDKEADYVSLSFEEANEINSLEDLQKFFK